MSRNNLWPRVTIPDVYPRDVDPERPAGTTSGLGGEVGLPAGPAQAPLWTRSPTRRAPVYRRQVIYTLNVGVVAVPLLGQIAEAETISVQVTSAAANPVFMGNQGVTVLTGDRVNPGQKWVLEEDNRRYQEEVVQAIQELTQVVATGGPGSAVFPPGAYYNPRVVINPNDWWVIAAAPRPVTVTLFYPPERV